VPLDLESCGHSTTTRHPRQCLANCPEHLDPTAKETTSRWPAAGPRTHRQVYSRSIAPSAAPHGVARETSVSRRGLRPRFLLHTVPAPRWRRGHGGKRFVTFSAPAAFGLHSSILQRSLPPPITRNIAPTRVALSDQVLWRRSAIKRDGIVTPAQIVAGDPSALTPPVRRPKQPRRIPLPGIKGSDPRQALCRFCRSICRVCPAANRTSRCAKPLVDLIRRDAVFIQTGPVNPRIHTSRDRFMPQHRKAVAQDRPAGGPTTATRLPRSRPPAQRDALAAPLTVFPLRGAVKAAISTGLPSAASPFTQARLAQVFGSGKHGRTYARIVASKMVCSGSCR